MAINESLFEIQVELRLGHLSQRIDISTNKNRLGVMGPTGCGKTSFVRSLLGLSQNAYGKISFEQRVMLDTEKNIFVSPWLRNISYAPQDFQLFPHLSVLENILFPQHSRLNERVIEELGLSMLLKRFPNHLSGGEKQRVAFARALCQSSKLMILDEPFSALDEKTKEKAIRFLDEYTRDSDRSILLISHDQRDLEALKCEIYRLSSV